MELRNKLLEQLGLQKFVVVDLETTGLEPDKDRIIEIGGIKYIDGEEAETFQTLINPEIPIPEHITRLTGISDSDVAGAPLVESIFDDFERFLGDVPFVGHQVNFDASFIEYLFRQQKNDFDGWNDRLNRFKYFGRVRLDTLFLSRIMMPFMPRLKLDYLAGYLGHDLENAHRAIDDARATGHVFLELLDRALLLDNSVINEIIQLLFANSVRAKSFFVPLLNFKREHNVTAPAVSMLDEIKNAQQYYNIIGEKEYKRTQFEDEVHFDPIDSGHVAGFFDSGGALSRVIERYESRPEQQEMSKLIADAINDGVFSVNEAGTGTGKSMAYMMPAIEWAVKNREAAERVVISTNTKNLQEQLFYKDLPTVFASRGGDFKAVLLKGRSNYLCLDKWKTVMTDMNQRLSQDERSRILPLVLWARQTRTGDIAENAAFQLENNRGLWQKFVAEPSYCPGKACKLYNECYLMKARDNARRADVVVVNHALLFSDLASDHSILGEFSNLVIDEAHNVEKTAAEHLGVRVSFWTFRNIYHRLYEEDPRKTGTILQLEYRMSQGQLSSAERNDLLDLSGRIKSNSMRLKHNTTKFYNEFNRYMRELQEKKSGKQNGDGQKIRYDGNFRYFVEHDDEIVDLKKNLTVLARQIGELNDLLRDLEGQRFEFQDQIHRELMALEQDVLELYRAFKFCLNAEEPKFVFWFEIPFSDRNVDVMINAVPLNISQLLKERLFDQLRSAVLTSATLSVNKNFNYFNNRIGLDLLEPDRVQGSIHGSPFDYKSQLFFGVTDFMPDPRNSEFSARLMTFIKNLHTQQKRGTMVLFTSYAMLNFVYDRIKDHCAAEQILLLAQGKSGSRTNIITQFKENRDAILLGTDSFWEGVDIPGEALQILIIPKLPFDVPTEPVIAARMEEIKERGGNAFFEYSVPEAVIKFRQGFGRLIRNKSDYGAVFVCDNRLSRMRYGQDFLNSLPVSANIYSSEQDLIDELSAWFEERERIGHDA